eukprot:4004010-Pleurochrysis_carterae.AAC.1
MAMGPSGRGASAPSCSGRRSASRGRAGRSQRPRFPAVTPGSIACYKEYMERPALPRPRAVTGLPAPPAWARAQARPR